MKLLCVVTVLLQQAAPCFGIETLTRSRLRRARQASVSDHTPSDAEQGSRLRQARPTSMLNSDHVPDGAVQATSNLPYDEVQKQVKKDSKKIDKNTIHNLKTTSRPTCATELAVRKHFSRPHEPLEFGSEMLRLVFHDALDFNNLQEKNGADVSMAGPYGGVDGCLFSGAGVDENGDFYPDPGYNNGLRHSITVSTRAQTVFPDISKADLKVAAALAALQEDARGPYVQMTWGREVPADCKDRAGKYQGNKDTNVGSTQFIKVNPDIVSFDHKALLDVFVKLGLDQTDMVALMGAHSYGDVSQCSKVLNKVEVGNFCDEGNQKPEHWELVGGHKQVRPVGAMNHHGNGVVTQPNTKGKWAELTRKFDDGAMWDQTPACFDNRYYKTFANANFAWKDGCCGTWLEKSKEKKKIQKADYCKAGRGGKYKKDKKKAEYAGARGGQKRDICDAQHPWCRSNWPYDGEEKRDKTTMRNVFDYAFENYQVEPFANGTYPFESGRMKPIFRMPPEWAMLSDQTSKALLQEFAADEKKFFDAFRTGFEKVLQLTPQASSLQTCSPVECIFESGNYNCAGMIFYVDNQDCNPASSGEKCSFEEVLGTRALIRCAQTVNLCCDVSGGCTKPLRAFQHKQQQTLGTCFDDPNRSEPNVGDTAANRDASFR